MEEPSGLSSPDKLLVDTNHKVPVVLMLVNPTLFSLETSDSELNNGPLRNTSRDVEQSPKLESVKMKKEDQEVSLTLNSIAEHLLPKQ